MLRRLPQPWSEPKQKHGAGFRRISGGWDLASSGDWDIRKSSFRHIARAPRCTVPYVWTRPPISWHALVPFTFRVQVEPYGPRISLRVPPGYAGDTTRRLVAHIHDPPSAATPAPEHRTGRRARRRRSRRRAGRVAGWTAPGPRPRGLSRSRGLCRAAPGGCRKGLHARGLPPLGRVTARHNQRLSRKASRSSVGR